MTDGTTPRPPSDPSWAELVARAFDEAPAPSANEAIMRVRGDVAATCGQAKSIEVVIRTTETPAELRARVMPTLPGVLEGFGASAHVDSGPTFLSVFLGDQLLFLTPKGFFEGLNAAAGPVALLP